MFFSIYNPKNFHIFGFWYKMEKYHFTFISGSQQTTSTRNVEEVSFELEDIEAGCSKDEVDYYCSMKWKLEEAGLFQMDFASTY